MKKFIATTFFSLALASSVNAQVMKNVLTTQQQDLAIIACLEAKGDLASLQVALNKGLDD